MMRIWVSALALALIMGCTAPVHRQAEHGLEARGIAAPVADDDLQALVTPPAGWIPEPRQRGDKHVQQVWISHTGETAYGVIRSRMPLPVGTDFALMGFMREMRRQEGEGRVLASDRDAELGGMRFIAEGGRYRIRANLFTRGFTAWVVFAGSLRNRPVNEAELPLAELAREATQIGLE